MDTFKTRISKISKRKGKIILANDYDLTVKNLEAKTIQNIKKLHPHLCAIKLNFHLLLPLGAKQISKINQAAHKYNLLTIADIKLNDIGNTNRITLENLWNLGFDAVIANPIMGLDSLKNLVKISHQSKKGVITLCVEDLKTLLPKIISYCKNQSGKKLRIYSPGVGIQGGKVNEVLEAGSDYLIVGRTILNAKNPVAVAKDLQLQSLRKQ